MKTDQVSGNVKTSGSDCILGKGLECAGRSCVSCGWNPREARRRKRLPLWRDKRGLWHKCIGRQD